MSKRPTLCALTQEYLDGGRLYEKTVCNNVGTASQVEIVVTPVSSKKVFYWNSLTLAIRPGQNFNSPSRSSPRVDQVRYELDIVDPESPNSPKRISGSLESCRMVDGWPGTTQPDKSPLKKWDNGKLSKFKLDLKQAFGCIPKVKRGHQIRFRLLDTSCSGPHDFGELQLTVNGCLRYPQERCDFDKQ